MKHEYKLNDDVIMKKPHACQTNLWSITRVGADIKIKCKNALYFNYCILYKECGYFYII